MGLDDIALVTPELRGQRYQRCQARGRGVPLSENARTVSI